MSEKAEKFLALQDEIEAVAFGGALDAMIAQLNRCVKFSTYVLSGTCCANQRRILLRLRSI